MKRLHNFTGCVGRWLRHEAGASLVEYAILVALIAVVSIVAVTSVGEGVSDSLSCSSVEIANPGIRQVVAEKINNGETLDSLEAKFSKCI